MFPCENTDPSQTHQIYPAIISRAAMTVTDSSHTICKQVALVLELHPPGDPERPACLVQISDCLYDRFRLAHSLIDLEEAIALSREALKSRPSGHPDRPSSLYKLARCILDRFIRKRTSFDLEEATKFSRDALALCFPSHPDRSASLHTLARCLREQFRKEKRKEYLEEMIMLEREALELRPPEHPDRSWALHCLADCLSRRFDGDYRLEDLEEAIILERGAVDLRPPGHPERHFSLHHLASYLYSHYCKESRPADLKEAITLTRAALDLRPSGHPERSSSLHDLALYLSNRFKDDGQMADLEEAISLGRDTVNHHTPDHPYFSTFNNLACCLYARYCLKNGTTDLDEAITCMRVVVVLALRPPNHPERSSTLREFALYLYQHLDKYGQMAALEEAITLECDTVILHTPDYPYLSASLDNLACYLFTRHRKEDRTADLDEAIMRMRVVLDLRPPGHPERTSSIHELALYLARRFDKHTNMADLEEAITLGRDAVSLRIPGHPYLCTSLKNLVVFLNKHYRISGSIRYLEEIIAHRRAILELQPLGHSERASTLVALRNNIMEMIHRPRAEVDLDKAIMLGREIVALYPQGDLLRTAPLTKLANCLKERFQKQGDIADLDELTGLCRDLLKVDFTDDHAQSFPFHDLALGLWKKFQNQGGTSNLDEAIRWERVALKLRRHADRVESLHALVLFLRTRLRQADQIDNVVGSIELERAALELCPLGHRDHVSSLQNLARCLSDRFDRSGALSDIEEAIKLTESALELRPREHPNRPMLLSSLTCYRRKKFMKPVAHSKPDFIRQLIKDAVSGILKTVPPRLLNTRTGHLCDRDSLIADFDNSPQYEQLLSSAAAYELYECKGHIRETVSAHFKYATLSHRWGKDEPLLRDIRGRTVYDMDLTDGLMKLQSFCATACECGYSWAWSDTCCIDKDSTVELAKAITSMFSWYRRSALTIVHLADIFGTGLLSSSVWFKRGWTLQELLAPRTVLFYTRDWSLYRECSSSNHKEDVVLLRELEDATGIAQQYLTNFDPGIDNARSRLQWASERHTTEPEDIAYSLFGIFNVYLPIIPGESAENAFGRLLAEIVTQSGDISVLSWVGEGSTFNSCFPAHISSYRSSRGAPPPLCAADLQASTSNTTDFKSCEASHKLFNSLSKLDPPQFSCRRLRLLCIMHRVTAVRLEDPPTFHVYEIHAEGLTPFKVELSHELEDATRPPFPYAVIRPWQSKLLGSSPSFDSRAADQLFTMMRQPFSPLLLAETAQNEYKRIASSSAIVTCPVDEASIIQSKVQIVTIA